MTKREVKTFLKSNQGYIKWGNGKLAEKFGLSYKSVKKIKKEISEEARVDYIDTITESRDKILEKAAVAKIQEKLKTSEITPTYSEFLEYIEYKKNKEAGHKPAERKLPKPFEGGDVNNVLVIGDLHEPFCLEDYLAFCREQQEKFNCGRVVFIGDIIDNSYSSYHESCPDGFSAGEELDRAIDKIANWYTVFPVADVLIGNHDRIVHRKATTSGVSKQWVRDYKEVLCTPNWNFCEEIVIDNVCYNHGEGGTARNRMKVEHQSQVQGHLHSQAYVEFSVGPNLKIFGMQVGCGVDRKSYAMAYGKNYKKPIISCAVVLNRGTLPIVLPMDLN